MDNHLHNHLTNHQTWHQDQLVETMNSNSNRNSTAVFSCTLAESALGEGAGGGEDLAHMRVQWVSVARDSLLRCHALFWKNQWQPLLVPRLAFWLTKWFSGGKWEWGQTKLAVYFSATKSLFCIISLCNQNIQSFKRFEKQRHITFARFSADIEKFSML